MASVSQQAHHSAPGYGLYLHIPYCNSKCGYCDFYSVAIGGRDPSPLVNRIERDLKERAGAGEIDVRTIFCGGGTPTVLPDELLASLLRALAPVVAAHACTEFTVEANPGTVNDRKAKLLVDGGVTRVSMGAQSFFPDELRTLERLHTPEAIERSVRSLRRAGLDQLSVDLIFGIPGQTLDSWAESLRRAADLGVDHLACYGLTYEPGTRLTAQRRAGRVAGCTEQLEADMYLHAVDFLTGAGFEHYEISNFARPGCACQHNRIYWQNGPYIGVGPSAVGCVDDRRYRNIADLTGYVRAIDERGQAEAESETLDRRMIMLEMIMMQLRLKEGLSIASFRARNGVDPPMLLAEPLNHLRGLGVVTVTDTHIALTREGLLVADAVIKKLAYACG